MSGQLVSWVGEHSRASYRGRAVLIQYAAAANHDGTPAADVTREDLTDRTGPGRMTVVYGRNEVLGRPTMVGGRNGRREVPGLACPELEELEAPGGRGRVGRHRLLPVLCPAGVKCWSCDALAKALKRPRPRAETVRPTDGSGATRGPETVRPRDGLGNGAEPGNRPSDGPTTVTAPPVEVSGDAGAPADNPDREPGTTDRNPEPAPGTTKRAATAASLRVVGSRGASMHTPTPPLPRPLQHHRCLGARARTTTVQRTTTSWTAGLPARW